jgi:HPt (histidine-containing phosphotransfer) domain-containing protein
MPKTPLKRAHHGDFTLEGRQDLLHELIGLFFEGCPQLLADIDQALQDDDANNLQIYAHRLKGCLRYFGESQAAEIASVLEGFGRDGELKKAALRRPELQGAVKRILPELRKFAEQRHT